MPDEKKRRPKSPRVSGLATELKRAAARRGLSHSELSRMTGISRTVLIGYEIERTSPGASELRRLCDALRVTPNRLLYGVEEPFKRDPLRDRLGLDTDDLKTVSASVFLQMLSREERGSLLSLAQAILEARHGRKKMVEAATALRAIEKALPGVADRISAAMEKALPPDELARIGKKVEKRLATASKKARDKS